MADLNFKIIQLEEGNKSLFFIKSERVFYKCDNTTGGTKYLICSEPNCGCRGKIKEGDNFMRKNNLIHNHENHAIRAEYLEAYEELRNLVKIDRRPIKQLHAETLRKLSLEASGMLTWNHCRKTLQRIRNAKLPTCSNLTDLINLLENESSEVFLKFGLLRSRRFYLGSVNGQPIFGNTEIISALPSNFEIYIDATFGILPFSARQLLVILAEVNGRPRPILYVIMNGQKTYDYEIVFKFVRDAVFGSTRTPQRATADFEQAILAALQNTWKGIGITGCNFHHAQAIRRKASKLTGLSSKISGDTMHHTILLMFMRISLLPIDRVETGFDKLLIFIEEKGLTDDFKEFISYFQNTWLSRFSKDLWCVSERTRRTNNNIEGYNHKVKLLIQNNPSAWTFLDSLLDLALDASSLFEHDRKNNVEPPKDRSKLSEPLKEALQQLNEHKIDEIAFLQLMAGVKPRKKNPLP